MSALRPLAFGGVRTRNNLMFAPLAGYSHRAMRLCALQAGAGYCVTEMVSVEGVLRSSVKTFRYADISGMELQSSIQLFGSDPSRFAEAALLLKEELGVRSINVNFGCPAPKVQRGGGGSELLKKPALMKAIIQALGATGLTVEAKIRAGYDFDDLEHIMEAVEEADCIILHCRLVRDKFSQGTADWSRFERARRLTQKTLIANGDILSPEGALELLQTADGVMIGRAAVAKPYLFGQISQLAEQGSYHSPLPRQKLSMLQDFAALWQRIEGREDIVPLRAALMSRIEGFEGAARLRSQLAQCRRGEDIRLALKDYQEYHTLEEHL